ncbi:MAG: ACT domain-containing protein [Planctomycetota bacterium]
MTGITHLPTLLASLQPLLSRQEYVFVKLNAADYGDGASLAPIACFLEDEDLTLIVPRSEADSAGMSYEGVFRKITLQVESSLDAVGLTAEVAGALADHAIAANVVAAFHHDHIFVPSSRAQDAFDVLTTLSKSFASVQ